MAIPRGGFILIGPPMLGCPAGPERIAAHLGSGVGASPLRAHTPPHAPPIPPPPTTPNKNSWTRSRCQEQRPEVARLTLRSRRVQAVWQERLRSGDSSWRLGKQKDGAGEQAACSEGGAGLVNPGRGFQICAPDGHATSALWRRKARGGKNKLPYLVWHSERGARSAWVPRRHERLREKREDREGTTPPLARSARALRTGGAAGEWRMTEERRPHSSAPHKHTPPASFPQVAASARSASPSAAAAAV